VRPAAPAPTIIEHAACVPETAQDTPPAASVFRGGRVIRSSRSVVPDQHGSSACYHNVIRL
jgi:hypothetical protein